MKRCEYKVLPQPTPAVMQEKDLEQMAKELEAKFNALGQEGWHIRMWQNGMMIFDREIDG